MRKNLRGNQDDPHHGSPSVGSDAVIPYLPSEASPSLPEGAKNKEIYMLDLGRIVGWCLPIIFLLTIYQTFVHHFYCPLDPATRDAIRRGWEYEKNQHNVLQHKWELERQQWRREVKERDRLEEEERQRYHMFWGNVEAHTCITYATRVYTAQLMNLPQTWKHRVDACKATPLEIHGISYLPNTCEDRGPGVVIGRWEINQHEPDCTTFWDSYDDKGCMSPGSGKKYITHKLMNLPEKGDWKEFCATTPVRFNHMQFPGPQECSKSLWGVYGQWEIDDSSC